MSSQKKSRGESEPARLKAVWREMSDDERSFWRELFVSQTTQAEIRRQLLANFKINLRHDNQLNAFRDWLVEQDLRDEEAQAVQDDEAGLKLQGLKGDQLRAELLKRLKARALTRGDFKLGAVAVNLDLKAEALALDREKFKEGLRTKVQAGLGAVLAEAKGNPAIAAAVKQIQEATE